MGAADSPKKQSHYHPPRTARTAPTWKAGRSTAGCTTTASSTTGSTRSWPPGQPGTIRIGLDIGGGSGTFAARMRERNVTVGTTTMNLDGPVQQLHRVPRAHLDAHERVPEAALLREHAGHRALDARAEQLDPGHDAGVRAVRYLPGAEAGRAVLLDRFFCEGPQLKGTYVRMMERIGFKKLRWNARRKVDRGPEKPQKNQWYFSALLEKPMT